MKREIWKKTEEKLIKIERYRLKRTRQNKGMRFKMKEWRNKIGLNNKKISIRKKKWVKKEKRWD